MLCDLHLCSQGKEKSLKLRKRPRYETRLVMEQENEHYLVMEWLQLALGISIFGSVRLIHFLVL